MKHRLHKILSPLGVGIHGFYIHKYGTNNKDHEHQGFITKFLCFRVKTALPRILTRTPDGNYEKTYKDIP